VATERSPYLPEQQDLHGKLKQQARTNKFFEFCNAKSGTLICTDVAARGLDIPEVDWVIQFVSASGYDVRVSSQNGKK